MLAVSSWSCTGFDWWRPISSSPDASTVLACVDDYAPVVPSSRCTAELEGVQVCPAGLAGYGFECHQGCWRRFADGVCSAGGSSAQICNGNAGPVTPAFACTTFNQGVDVCPAGEVGYGYQCTNGCWSLFYGGPCAGAPIPDGGYCPGPVGPVQPSIPCTAGNEGREVCPAGQSGYGYTCHAGCWQLFYDGVCSPDSHLPDGGPDGGDDAGVCGPIGGPVAPPLDCTASIEGSMLCPEGLAGYGYQCRKGCWSLFFDSPCTAPWVGEGDAGWRDAGSSLPAAGNVCGASGPVVPTVSCTSELEGSQVCPAGHAGYGYHCAHGCWSLFSDGPCAAPTSHVDAGSHP